MDTLENVIVIEGIIIKVEPIPIKIFGKTTFCITIYKLSPANIIQAIKVRITPVNTNFLGSTLFDKKPDRAIPNTEPTPIGPDANPLRYASYPIKLCKNLGNMATEAKTIPIAIAIILCPIVN